MSDASVPSGDAQNTELNPGTAGRKRKKSTAETSSLKKTTPVRHAEDNNGDGKKKTAAVRLLASIE